MKALTALLILALAAAPALAQDAQDKITPLFADDEVLDVTINGPIRSIARQAERSTDPRPATLESGEETHSITLAARGVSRRKRENCRFPPLRIAFPDKPGETSLFHKQGRIKLVTHCSNSGSGEQTMLREYAAYRLYNLVTPESLRVRLARISYVDGDKSVATKLGFFIEDADDAARRLDMKEVDIGNIDSSRVNRDDAARFALFQYMIGNTDWAMIVGPDPTDCCHNAKLLGPDDVATTDLTPVPYDFDNSGLVDASYAFPNAVLGTSSVKTRVYRGFCTLNELIPAEADRLLALRPAFEAELASTPFADPKTVRSMTRYLAGYYSDAANAGSIAEFLRKCR